MSRLIDADALKQELGYIDAIPAVTERDIDNAPTIPAIPVEWLKQIQHGCVADVIQVPMYVAIGWLIDMWQKEQEAKNAVD